MASKYYAMIDGERKGPYTLEELPAAGVRPSTYIWCKGMPDWQKAEDNADVCRLFRNHLYDVMHPDADAVKLTPEELDKYKVKPDSKDKTYPSRFDYYLKDSGESLPTIDEIESNKDTSQPPVSMVVYAWLVTIFCCPLLGIVALVYAYKSKKAWKRGEKAAAHEYNRSAMMWTGIAFFIGLIVYAFFMAFNL